MRTIPVILPRRSFRCKNVAREGCRRFQVEVTDATGIMIGVAANVFWIDWGDGNMDSDLMHTYEKAGAYEVVISGIDINQLNLSHCWLRSIDLSACPWLEYINVSFNFLKELDVSCCPYLTVLLCERNLLRKLKLGDNLPWLVYLDCSCNLLGQLEFPSDCGLQYLLADSNQLVCLHFRNCPYLYCADIADNIMQPPALQEALDSLPTVPAELSALVMYELNPAFWQVDEMQLLKKGWHYDGDGR